VRSSAVIDLESNIARGRIVLSLVTLASVFVDPTTPHLAAWMPVSSGPFLIDTHLLQVLTVHTLYGVTIWIAVRRRPETLDYLPGISTVLDVAFAALVTLFTEGPTTPSFVFFAFVIVAVGCRSDFRATAISTAACTLLYLLLIALLTPGDWHLYVMRPAYLAITGYLIGFLGQQRVNFEERIRELETAAERQSIARFLHDGYAQGLAGVNLRLETCRQLLQNHRAAEALEEVTELQTGVAREFDDVRAYIRSLAEVADAPARDPVSLSDPRCHLRAVVTAPGSVLEQVLQILLEGIRNTRRHARAGAATIDVAEDRHCIRIAIQDDGVGFQNAASPPWSIASRVAECGGHLAIAGAGGPGAHLEIELPLATSEDHGDSYRPRG
jgi:signal transduction histidine kinase